MQYLLTQQYPFYSWYHILIDFTGLALNSFFLLYLLKQSFGIKASLRRQKTYFYLAAAVTTLGFIATGEISHHKGYIYYTTFLFFGILFSALLFEGSFSIKFISVILYTSSVIAINGFVETLLYAICNLSDYSKLSVSLFTLLFIIKRIGEYVFVYFLVRFLIYLSPKRFFSIPKIYWLSYLILLLIGIIQAYTSIFGSLKNITSLLNFSIILGTNLCIYYFFNTSIAQYNSKLQYSLENQQLQLEQRHLQEINQLYENLRKLRHELKNHILCMDILLQEQNYEELSTYFLALKEAQPLAPSLDFGNHSINALLNTKLAIAKEKDISFSIEAHVPTHLYISDFDICSILGNLCDNAMEACEASSEKNMKLAILEYGSYLSVTLRNDTTSDVLSLNPTLLTTKKDKQLHGIGIQIVKTIAKKYDGLVFFKTEENQFIASVQLKNQKKHSDTT